ncbi:MAG TPA: chemotaxis protein CheW [Bacillota bacterium]|nr:chemotaxis protein CheW [Bacillota bacterium]HPT87876.1 chemotaxis protein CheW [Bacillota bacterium]
MKAKEQVVEETKQLIIFKLGEEEFGVDILQVREIEKLDQNITRVPKAPAFVEGVINLRGEIVPIVDLRKRFGLSLKPIGSDTRVVIVEINDNLVGMMVDAVVEVLRINVSAIEDAPQITKGVDAYFLSGVAKVGDRLIVLLNLDRALSAEEAKELRETDLGE